jgi:hypothetical protein
VRTAVGKLGAIALMAVAAVAAACGSSSPPKPPSVGVGASTTTSVSIQNVDFANRSYAVGCGDGPSPITLADGTWTSPQGPAQGVVGQLQVSYGAFTGTGDTEALVSLLCTAGSAPATAYVLVYQAGAGGPEQVGQVVTGSAPIPLAGGGFTTTDPVFLAGDAKCCPSYQATTTWRYGNGSWQNAGTTRTKTHGTAGQTPAGTGPAVVCSTSQLQNEMDRTAHNQLGQAVTPDEAQQFGRDSQGCTQFTP